MKETRCSRTTGWCQVPWRVRLFWKDQGWRAQNRIAEKEQIKCTLAALRPLPWWRDGGVLHVCGVHHHQTLHQEDQGRSGDRGREPGHPHEFQGGVSPGGRPQHQGTARIWKINFAPNLSFSGQGGSYWLLLSNYWNFLFGTEPLLSSLFLFWRIDWQGGLAPKDLSTDRLLLLQKNENSKLQISDIAIHYEMQQKVSSWASFCAWIDKSLCGRFASASLPPGALESQI